MEQRHLYQSRILSQKDAISVFYWLLVMYGHWIGHALPGQILPVVILVDQNNWAFAWDLSACSCKNKIKKCYISSSLKIEILVVNDKESVLRVKMKIPKLIFCFGFFTTLEVKIHLKWYRGI